MNAREAKIRLSRQLGIAITPKAGRMLERRPRPPGQHGGTKDRLKGSDYKRRLIEKQRLRAQYNIEEKQMRNYVKVAMQRKGNPADALIRLLETRLDAAVYRAGLARTIYQARQFVSHGHILVNGKTVDFPSKLLKPGDIVTVSEESRKLIPFQEAAAEMVARSTVPYLERSREQMSAKLLHVPNLAEVPLLCEMSMVIEFYSR
ncbi:MAG: 30S ribosomal protein S4 [Syntrophobacteraceae bacterium]|nr:30S ribosomal protein S4 [Syntrophobacteraceae bacterium]